MAPRSAYFDGNRIGPDVAPFWRILTRDERAAPTAAAAHARRRPERRDGDPQHADALVDARPPLGERPRLPAGPRRTARSSRSTRRARSRRAIGLSGGMMLSSDDLDECAAGPARPHLDAAAAAAALGGAARPHGARHARAIRGRVRPRLRPAARRRAVQLRRRGARPRRSLPAGRLARVRAVGASATVGVVEGSLDIRARRAARLPRRRARARRRARRPSSRPTAHIGMGALDVVHGQFDAADGCPRRAAWAGGPGGPPHLHVARGRRRGRIAGRPRRWTCRREQASATWT